MNTTIFILISIVAYVIWIIVFYAAFWTEKDWTERDRIRNELGLWGLFYFTTPGFSLVYHFVIEHYRKKISFGWVKEFFVERNKMKHISKLLEGDPEIQILKVAIVEKHELNPVSYEAKTVSQAKLNYRYKNPILDKYFDVQVEYADGVLADKLKSLPLPLNMSKDELRLMLLNNRIDNLSS